MKLIDKNRILRSIELLISIEETMDEDMIRQDLLENMQEVAIETGNFIEECNDNSDIVKLLEMYCENIYERSIGDLQSFKKKKLIQDANVLLKNIKVKIKDIKEEKLKVVFFPYNSSMWDALDSVYKEAVKDDRVVVKVIPIPYYNLNDNGVVINYNYEGEKFPSYINVVDYNEYDISKEKPDLVFIHNPYDQYNKLTRVIPQYYSSELVQHTEHLVYIPYYIVDKRTSTAQCIMPGVKNAWKVYVQSDTVKNQMIMFNDKSKIRALGSPKIDSVINLEKNKPEIPVEWKAALKGRKIFLIATTIESIINRPDIFFEKIKKISEIFKQNPNIAMIFRPHPLTKKYFNKSMLAKYNYIVENMELLENVVVDESSDNQRAIALSDAYIGERSSMMTLYKIIHKPIYLMDWGNDLILQKDRYIEASAMNIFENNIWIFHSKINALFKKDINSGKIQYVLSVENESKYQKNMFKDILFWNDYILLVAARAKYNVLVDLKTNNQTQIPTLRTENKLGQKNSCVFQEGDKVYMFPEFYGDNILIYDFSENNYKEIYIDYNQIGSKDEKMLKVLMWGEGSKTDSGFIIPFLNSSEVMFIYLNGEQKLIHIDYDYSKSGFCCSCVSDNKLYLLSRSNQCLIEYDILENKCEKILDNKCKVFNKQCNNSYSKVICVNQKLFLIPLEEEQILEYNLITTEVKIWPVKDNQYLTCKIKNNILYAVPFSGKDEVVIDIESEQEKFELNRIPSINSNVEFKEFWRNNVTDIDGEQYIYNETVFDINEFICEVLKNSNKEIDSSLYNWINNADGSCGEKIWKDIMKSI